jgi:CheY-like chemotaxis protein
MNIGSNAVKFTAEGAVRMTVELVGSAEEPACRFVVRDTGMGIPVGDRKRIFEQYTQLGIATAPREGTGLGLHIVEQIVEAMNGSVEVDSDVGVGTTFTVTIPFAPAASAPPPNEPVAVRAESPGGDDRWPLSVLLVDDTKVNRDLAEAMLTRMCTAVSTAQDGREALALFERQRPDVVLMDVQMPVLDGLEATRAIRGLEAEAGAARVPIIVVTGQSTDGHRRTCLEAGADECLFKPFGVDDLREVIRPFAEKSRAQGWSKS